MSTSLCMNAKKCNYSVLHDKKIFVLSNLLNALQKTYQFLCKPHILSLFLKSFDKFNNTWALIWEPLCSILAELINRIKQNQQYHSV